MTERERARFLRFLTELLATPGEEAKQKVRDKITEMMHS